MAKSPLYEIIDRSENSPYFVAADAFSLVGSGGGADVFRSGGANGVALKIYRAPALTDWIKIEYQVAHPIYKNGRPAKSQYNFAWPNGVIRLDGKNVGITLQYIDRKKWISLDNWTEPRLLKKLSPENSSLSRKLAILRNLARRIAELHARNISVIDLRPSNVLANISTGEICLIDCDSFRIESPDGRIFPGSHVSAGYIIPEAIGQTLDIEALNKEQDLYALAVITFQVLNFGIHPFQGILTDKTIDATTDDQKARLGLYAYDFTPSAAIKPLRQSTHVFWPSQLRKMFSKSFATGSVRPSARQWHSEFNKILYQKHLQRCHHHPNDPSHIKFEDLQCGACWREKIISEIKTKATVAKIEKAVVSRPSPPTSPPANAQGTFPIFGCLLAIIGVVIMLAVMGTLGNRRDSDNTTLPTSNAGENDEGSNLRVDALTRHGEMIAGKLPIVWGDIDTYPTLTAAESAVTDISKTGPLLFDLGPEQAKFIEDRNSWWFDSESGGSSSRILRMYIKNDLQIGIRALLLYYSDEPCGKTSASRWLLVNFGAPIPKETEVVISGQLDNVPNIANGNYRCAIVTKVYGSYSLSQTKSQSNQIPLSHTQTENKVAQTGLADTPTENKIDQAQSSDLPSIAEALNEQSCPPGIFDNCVSEYLFKTGKYAGDRYRGAWKNGKPDGYGIYIFNSGGRYEGYFSDGKRNGTGTEYDQEGKVVSSGFWYDNVLQ